MRLEISGVGIKIGPTTIVHESTILVAAGEMAGLIGPNGSGKSTLLRAVYRHLRPVVGAVLVGGHDVWHSAPARAARRTGAVPQERFGDVDVSVRTWWPRAASRISGPFQADTVVESAYGNRSSKRVKTSRRVRHCCRTLAPRRESSRGDTTARSDLG